MSRKCEFDIHEREMNFSERHQCMIYDGSPATHLSGLAAVIHGKLQDRYRCLCLDNPGMISGLRSCLYEAGVDVPRETRSGALVLTSDRSHLVNGKFDAAKMLAMIADAANEAKREGYEGLWASGDMTWELGHDVNIDVSQLVEYERCLHTVFFDHPTLHGICRYRRDILPAAAIQCGLVTHRVLYLSEKVSLLNPYCGPTGLPLDPRAPDFASRLDGILRDLAANS